jgi:LEA14-like dessication related protein
MTFGEAPMRRIIPALALTFLSLSCTKPDPPVLTPKSATVTAVTATGVGLSLSVEAYNPNGVDLSAQSVTGKVVLDGKYDLGTSTIAKPVNLPAGARTTLDIPLSVNWNDMSALATIATTNRPAPYTVDGTVTVGGGRLNVDLPFHMTGAISHEEILQATARSIPAIPGMPGFKLPTAH